MGQDAPPEDFNIIHPDPYAEYGYPHHVWTRLRADPTRLPACYPYPAILSTLRSRGRPGSRDRRAGRRGDEHRRWEPVARGSRP